MAYIQELYRQSVDFFVFTNKFVQFQQINHTFVKHHNWVIAKRFSFKRKWFFFKRMTLEMSMSAFISNWNDLGVAVFLLWRGLWSRRLNDCDKIFSTPIYCQTHELWSVSILPTHMYKSEQVEGLSFGDAYVYFKSRQTLKCWLISTLDVLIIGISLFWCDYYPNLIDR